MASFYVRVNEAHAQADELGRYVNELSNVISGWWDKVQLAW